MGIIQKYTENNCRFAIWNITESLVELLELGTDFDVSNFKTEKRKKEFIASRLLLNELEPNQQISYNSNGAPEIDNGKFISISHSKNLVAIIISDKKVGLDIEKISNKPLKLSSKFMPTESCHSLSEEKATLVWCCKEAIYKWHQKGNVDFKEDIKLIPFILEEKGIVSAEFDSKNLKLNYTKLDSHFLAYICK